MECVSVEVKSNLQMQLVTLEKSLEELILLPAIFMVGYCFYWFYIGLEKRFCIVHGMVTDLCADYLCRITFFHHRNDVFINKGYVYKLCSGRHWKTWRKFWNEMETPSSKLKFFLKRIIFSVLLQLLSQQIVQMLKTSSLMWRKWVATVCKITFLSLWYYSHDLKMILLWPMWWKENSNPLLQIFLELDIDPGMQIKMMKLAMLPKEKQKKLFGSWLFNGG